MDLGALGLSDHVQALILQGAGLLTLALPVLEKLSKLTKTDVDDRALTVLEQVLGFIPRIRFGHGVTEKMETK